MPGTMWWTVLEGGKIFLWIMDTVNVYAHLMKPVNQETTRRLENTVFENYGSKMVAEGKKGITENPQPLDFTGRHEEIWTLDPYRG